MTIQIFPFSDLSKDDFHDLLALRVAVFVVEQNCAYQELDGKDKEAFHLVVKTDDHKIVGTLRILKPGISYPEVSIGRVASHPNYRNQQLGHRMMKVAMAFIAESMHEPPVRISAQSHLCNFYAQYDFKKTGKEYLEDDIPHSEMLFTPTKA